MTVAYNMVPMEIMMPMIAAEHANIPVLTDAAKMWTEVREWVDATQRELNTRAGQLSPQWTDDAGREHEEKIQRTLAELKMWGERLDAAQVPATLTTLASDIQNTFQVVSGLNATYVTVAYNPLTAAAAVPLQQAAGTKMTELGGHFDMSMLKVVSGAGLETPGDVLPSSPKAAASTQGNSPADFIKAATSGINFASAGLDDLQDLQSLGSSAGGGTGTADVSGSLPAGSSGLSLAGLAPNLTAAMPVAGSSLGVLPPAGSAPVPTGLSSFAGASATAGLMPLAKPVAGKRTPSLAGEARPGVAETPATAKSTTGTAPPMMSSGLGQGTAGTLRPSSAESPTGPSGSRRKPTTGTDGVPTTLRGRSGNGDPTDFTLGRRKHTGETESGSLQLLDEDLWSATR